MPGLTAESFKIYEDGQPVSALESKQTILNPEVTASHYTLLLVDMSGSVTLSGDVPVIVDSARAFTERVQKFQKVGVYVFDGSVATHLRGGQHHMEPTRPRARLAEAIAGRCRAQRSATAGTSSIPIRPRCRHPTRSIHVSATATVRDSGALSPRLHDESLQPSNHHADENGSMPCQRASRRSPCRRAFCST